MAAGRARCFRLLEQITVNKRALPNRTRHDTVLALALLPRVATRNDEFLRRLVVAGLLALGREAPWCGPLLAAVSASPVRMVDRIHRDAAVVRHAPHPALAAGLADRDVHVIRVRHRPNRCRAAAMHQALLARVEAQD